MSDDTSGESVSGCTAGVLGLLGIHRVHMVDRSQGEDRVMANVAGAVLDAMNSLREGNVKQIRCEVSVDALREAVKFSGLCITGEGENLKIMKVPEAIRSEEEKRYGVQIERNLEDSRKQNVPEIDVPDIDLGDVHIPRKRTLTPEQELAAAEAKLSHLENKIYGLEGDIAWLVDAMRRIGEQLKSRT